jgi:hypothetical protein
MLLVKLITKVPLGTFCAQHLGEYFVQCPTASTTVRNNVSGSCSSSSSSSNRIFPVNDGKSNFGVMALPAHFPLLRWTFGFIGLKAYYGLVTCSCSHTGEVRSRPLRFQSAESRHWPSECHRFASLMPPDNDITNVIRFRDLVDRFITSQAGVCLIPLRWM